MTASYCFIHLSGHVSDLIPVLTSNLKHDFRPRKLTFQHLTYLSHFPLNPKTSCTSRSHSRVEGEQVPSPSRRSSAGPSGSARSTSSAGWCSPSDWGGGAARS